MEPMQLRTIPPERTQGKRVLLRVDVNIPHDTQGWPVVGSVRVRAAARTIAAYAHAGARVIVLAHRGEPKGADPLLSIERVAEETMREAALGARGRFVEAMPLQELRSLVRTMAPGDVLWLENIRFHPGEMANSEVFAQELATLGELYVNDAFGVLHRRQASVCALTKFLPTYAGPTVVAECAALEHARSAQEHPCVAVVGGGKLSTKMGALSALLQKADTVFLGTGLAALFVAAQGKEVGRTPVSVAEVELARTLLHHPAIRLPEEVLLEGVNGQTRLGSMENVQPDEMMVDWGSRALPPLHAALKEARLVFWNGPVGVVERPHSRVGTDVLAQAIAQVGRTPKTYAVAGGGETVEAIEVLGLADFFDWVSTGGGAMLAFVGDEPMPGLEPLML